MKKSMGGGDEASEVEGAVRRWRVRSDGGERVRRVRVRWVKAELGETREGEGGVGVGGSGTYLRLIDSCITHI